MMRKLSLVLISLIIGTFSYSQQTNSMRLSNESGEKSIVGFGGPLLSGTQIHNNFGLLLGGKGGVIFNGKFAFGGIGMGLINKPEFNRKSLDENGMPIKITSSLGAGGIFVEYIVNPGCPVIFSVPVNIMGGGVSVKEIEPNQKIESSGIFIVEPGVNISFAVSKNFRPAFNISYRKEFGVSMENIDKSDISGLNIGVVLKFGNFQ